jgi:imidazolonepropionase-like amidohydrolase
MHPTRALHTSAAAACLVGALLWPRTAAAQFDDPPQAAAFALQGVTVVGADGSRTPGVTIVVRRGFIEAMGPDVAVPPGAELLEGDSLLVYPGMIDAQGEADVEFPEKEIDRTELAFWAPPREAQGFVPHRRLVEYLTATGGDFKAQRSDGVVAIAVHPEGALMPGRGAVLVLRKGAETPHSLVEQPELGPVMSFDGAGGMYPSTIFAAAAFLRQNLEDARHDGLLQAAHQQDPRGLKAPAWDPDYAVLRSVMTGQVPVFFAADRAADIRRALALGEEYGFRPVITGGAEAWRVADLLRARQVPVLVSLDFPEPKQWDPDEEEDEPLDAAAEREKQDLENRYANAGRLAAAGVTFALTSGGGEADIREGVGKVIEYGLSEDAALAAVTSSPGALLGLEYLTRVEAGMAATFVVTDGPLFGEDSKVLYTFVEGGLEEVSTADEAGEPPTVDVTGVWDVETSFGNSKATLTQDGSEVTGSIESPQGRAEIQSGKVSGNEITLMIQVDAGDEMFDITYTGTVEGDEMKGNIETPFGSSEWSAKRVAGPGEGE